MKPMLNGKRLSIAIPASVVSDTPHLREKTSKIGLIGRAAAIFKINQIIIYPDLEIRIQEREIALTSKLLNYMETPQYLRKTLFKIDPQLQYAGILPPLRTPHHPLCQGGSLRVGEYREAVALSHTTEGTLVEVGLSRSGIIVGQRIPVGKRVTTRVKKTDGKVELELADRNEIRDYWGYTVTEWRGTLGRLFQNREFDLQLATSRYGLPFIDVIDQVRERWEKSNSVLMAFGAPARGLKGILEREGLCLEKVVEFVVNTLPNQGTETVRTEEAVLASLAAFNIFSL